MLAKRNRLLKEEPPMLRPMRLFRAVGSTCFLRKGFCPRPMAPWIDSIMIPWRLNPRPSSPWIWIGIVLDSDSSPFSQAAKTWWSAFVLEKRRQNSKRVPWISVMLMWGPPTNLPMLSFLIKKSIVSVTCKTGKSFVLPSLSTPGIGIQETGMSKDRLCFRNLSRDLIWTEQR